MQYANRRAYLDNKHKFTIITEEAPLPDNNEVLIKIVANGICGSDIHFYHEGRLGNFVVTKPYVPGHEASGIIVKVGKDVKGFSRDERVVIEPGIPCGICHYCKIGRYNLCKDVVFLSAPPINGTFCDYIAIRSDVVHKMPEGLTFEQASLVEPTAVAVYAVNKAGCVNGASGVIVGAGPIGLLTMQAFKAAGGGKAICIDVVDSRLEAAKVLGADEVINITAYQGELSEIADVVFETAGSPKATEALFTYAKTGGHVVQVGWPAGNNVTMNIADFLDKELNYIGVNRYANAFPTAIAWIADGRINVNKLITQKFTLDQIDEAFKYTLENPKEVIKVVVTN